MAHQLAGKKLARVPVLTPTREAISVQQLEAKITALLANGFTVVVDLDGVSFIDAATLFVLLRARRAAAARGVGFSVQVGPVWATA